jgi:hypothetical protein
MTKSIEIIKKPRLGLLNLISELSIEQLNKIPAGFNNNIAWNLGHMIATQQGVCYKRAGLDTVIGEDFYKTYAPETKPEKFIDQDELETIKGLFISTLDRFETDCGKNLFSDYIPWTTRYGVELASIQDVLKFLPFHEGLHVGYIWALKRAVSHLTT